MSKYYERFRWWWNELPPLGKVMAVVFSPIILLTFLTIVVGAVAVLITLGPIFQGIELVNKVFDD